MNLLIVTEPDDTHALFVKLAVEQLGHQATLLFTADQPTLQKNSVLVDMERYLWKSVSQNESILENEFDVVWWRRPRKPYLPKTWVHPEDHQFVARENILFHESFTHNIAPNAWWVNTKESASRANFKLLQLKIASDCGMKIPTTLCSNDPSEIREFIARYAEEGVIYKPLCSNVWFEDDCTKIVYTSKVKYDSLPSDDVLQQSPGIFQKHIKKKYELRVTCFGDYLVAAKLNSQEHIEGQVDWRLIRSGKMNIEPYNLPEDLSNQLRQFMKEIGIVFGCVDLIVTLDNEYIFLEVNEQGQFLWIEEYCSDFKMLDIFVQFLLQRTVDFQWNAESFVHSLERYRAAVAPLYEHHMNGHVDLNRANVS